MRLCLITFLLFMAVNCFASDTKGKLSEIISQIKNIKSLLQKHQSEQLDLQKNLQKTELAINHVSLQLTKTVLDLKQKKLLLDELHTQSLQIEQRIRNQQLLLLKQIRNSYMLGLNKNKLQLLLQSNDPNKINRLLTYNRYLTQQTNSLINDLKSDLMASNNNKQAIMTNTSRLILLKQNQALQQKKLTTNRQKQQAVLNHLALQLKTHTQQLAELEKNKKNLESVIQHLQHKEKTYVSDFLTHHTGKFPWPTQGRILEQFGSQIQHSELRQNGVVIGAPEGQKVYAVAPGRVIFANWMPGYGLLLIVDHGKGYMTLYGNNAVLYKKNHDLIGAHETIAAVGHTGGRHQSALYFALRHNGVPISPNTWCH